MNDQFGIREKNNNNNNSDNIDGKYLIYIGDLYFEKKYYRESLRYYLLGCAVENSFFSNIKKTQETMDTFLFKLSHRIFDCLFYLKLPMQAIVVSQLFDNSYQASLVSFKMIQDEYYHLDPNYFQFIWDIPLLEMLLTKRS
ncbi:hypothetical protein CYY_006541 [Polysphondylium violaceum]|uniref:INTS8 TPR repeats domain-containing protein n=1 Tax=Polysphondylium violaceum TaxID=133409 RepID=A0A8J4PR69_9MYCE|nr:hypothetical protein CYY_006541 [Polysphondylium violaceum]